jgi:cytochrome oxidase Cu insertion factor (SCO1/SenC/PrrC family)
MSQSLMKMMMRFQITIFLLISCALQSLVLGQDRGHRRGGGGENMPKVGSLIPDISVFDTEGRSFALREKLKGRHTVIVFGCLT